DALRQRPRPDLESGFAAPRNPTEEALSNIWREVLGLDRVGVWDNFFELGGDSVLMTQIASRIRESVAADMSLRSFFESPTVAGLARAISDKQNDFLEELLTEIDRISEDEVQLRLTEEGLPLRDAGNGSTVQEGPETDSPTPSDPIRSFDRPPSQDGLPAIASVGITTYNRLKALERALTGYIQNSTRHGRSNDFVVIDDPDTKEIQSRCRDMLGELKRRYGVEILYGGREDKVIYADRLIARSGVPEEVVRFALLDVEECGQSYGVSRNALLLHSVGDMAFSADDDTICRLSASPEQAPGLALTSEWDPAEVWFFPDRETALQSASGTEADLLAIHEQLLGKNASALAAQSGNGHPSFDPGLLKRHRATQGKVLATFNGLLGDCAWGAPFGYWGGPMGCLILNEKSHRRLIRSEADYRSACASRDILRVVDRLTISEETLCMTVFMGFDNRDLLPPFLPVKRGEDIVFGLTLRRCFENGYFGHLPWALVH
ncbi:MAG: phosphopantetheine-binding protein, partial [Candidatus Binatia bacterium]